VDFDFSTSALKRLNPGEHLVLVANPTAFAARYGAAMPVAGQYVGRLDNGGERLRLVDAQGEEILDFGYKDWFPSADGGGFSMEIVDELASPGSWGDKTQWRVGNVLGGSPGSGGPAEGLQLSAELTPAGLRLRFPAMMNQRYSLQVSEALELGVWSSVLEVPALPNTRTIERTEPISGLRRSYRVVVPTGP
jgi:hypothetical protein